jgi:RimJ/RimL family protein N-acetyltransferase
MAGTDGDTSRLWLRTWTHDAHSDSFAAILADPVAMRFISGGEPLPRQVADEISLHSERLWNEGFGPWAAFLKDNDSFVGRIGLNRVDDWPGEEKIEVGFELAPGYWNRGLATEGAQEAVRFGFQAVGLTRIISVTSLKTLRRSVSWRNVDCDSWDVRDSETQTSSGTRSPGMTAWILLGETAEAIASSSAIQDLQRIDRNGLLAFFASMGWMADLPDADRLSFLDDASFTPSGRGIPPIVDDQALLDPARRVALSFPNRPHMWPVWKRTSTCGQSAMN